MPEFTMPEVLDGLSLTELTALREAALAAFAALRGSAETPDALAPATLDAMEVLAANIESIDAASTALSTAAAAHTARADGLANRFPVASTPEPEVVPEPEAEPAAAPDPVPVVAAAPVVPAPRRPSAAAVVANAPAVVVPTRSGGRPIIAAASDMPSASLGQRYDSLNDNALRTGLMRHIESMPRSGDGHAKGTSFSLTTEYPEELVASGPHDTDVLRRAVDQARLPGGGIIAAGGWCAPPDQRYDVCTTASMWGAVSLPTVQIPRGSMSYFQNLDYSAVAANLTNAAACYTAAELEDDDPMVEKPCFEIPCIEPVSLTLDVCSICLRVGILQAKAFPELISAYVDQLLVAHAHFLNARDITQMLAINTADGSTATLAATFGAIAPFLDGLDLQATALRYREGRPLDSTVEAMAPAWLSGEFRSDYTKREIKGSASAMAEISAGLAERNISMQWVSDWQDSAFVAAAPGPLLWPATADVLLYSAGALVKGETGVIDVGPMYDSTLLTINRQQLLFAETASQIGRFCGGSVLVTVPLCPSGETAGRVDAIGENDCPTY